MRELKGTANSVPAIISAPLTMGPRDTGRMSRGSMDSPTNNMTDFLRTLDVGSVELRRLMTERDFTSITTIPVALYARGRVEVVSGDFSVRTATQD